MYYYIAEPASTPSEQKRLDEIRTILDQLGISGEFSTIGSGRTVNDYLELALRKHFTTVVGIGSDSLADTIAASILHYDPEHTALGMIPLQPGMVSKMIGGGSLRDFCQILRARLLVPIDTITLNPQAAFITTAAIHESESIGFQLQYDQLKMVGEFTDLTIHNTGLVQMWNGNKTETAKPGLIGRLFGSSQPPNLSLTQFVGQSWSFETDRPCSVAVAGQIVTETPLQVNYRPKTLKLIVNRARISPDNTLIQRGAFDQ